MSDISDSVEVWASMIHQEGKSAALEIAESAGCEAALDAMEHLRVLYERQMVRYRDAALVFAAAIERTDAPVPRDEWLAFKRVLSSVQRDDEEA